MTTEVAMADIKTEKHIYSVTELTRYMRAVLEDTFPSVWVEGEVSNFTLHTSGHMYFSLKDASSVLNCVMFKNANQNLKFKMAPGLKVICSGRVSIYEKRGQYQLYVEKMEPKGLGALQLAFEQLKERLRKEGLFDEKHKKEIPYLPYKIGIVTSPTGAAIRDMLQVTRQRFQNVDLIINPVRVQGKGSAEEIARAIDEFNEFGDVDVMIVGRGGGSLEDLWAFNEEIVARAIYNSRIPVISAVGHEVDVTIADFVADSRAATPSAAAAKVIPRKEELEENIGEAKTRLRNAVLGNLNMLETRLKHLRESYVFRQPLNIVEQQLQRIDDLVKGASLGMSHIVELNNSSFAHIAGKLESLSPLAVLKRGYSITMKMPDKSVLKDTKSVKSGDKIKTKLGKGILFSRIERIEGAEND
jgi:exodeoxyribonuclease VII large subunit